MKIFGVVSKGVDNVTAIWKENRFVSNRIFHCILLKILMLGTLRSIMVYSICLGVIQNVQDISAREFGSDWSNWMSIESRRVIVILIELHVVVIFPFRIIRPPFLHGTVHEHVARLSKIQIGQLQHHFANVVGTLL